MFTYNHSSVQYEKSMWSRIMIPCLHPATAAYPNPEAFVRLAARNGFQGVEHSAEYWAQWVDRTSLAYVAEYCDEMRCAIVHGALPLPMDAPSKAFRSELRKLPRIATTLNDLGTRFMCASVAPATPEPYTRAWERYVRRLRDARKILVNHGLELGLEFTGAKSARATGHPFVYDLSGTLELCAAVGEGCGLLLDAYSWHASHGTVDDLLMLNVDQVFHVHISDAFPGPVDKLPDRNRMLPGAGAIDLNGFLGALARIGYAGAVSVKTYSDTLRLAGPDESARLASKAISRVLGQVV
jgi:sugar phosphate isomerase/epimerase